MRLLKARLAKSLAVFPLVIGTACSGAADTQNSSKPKSEGSLLVTPVPAQDGSVNKVQPGQPSPAGVGSTPVPPKDQTEPDAERSRALVVKALATRPSHIATSARYFVSTFLGARPTGDGVADFRSNEYFFQMRGEWSPTEKLAFDIFITGNSMYSGAPGTDTASWQKFAFSPENIPLMVPDIEILAGETPWPRPTNDQEVRRKVFDAIVQEVQFVAREQVRSDSVRHYKVQVDGQKGQSKLPAELRSMAGQGALPVDLWIDEKGRLRKLSTAERSYELWDLDAVPHSELPAAKFRQ